MKDYPLGTLVVVFAGVAACGSVPDIYFVDASADGQLDGSVTDGASDADDGGPFEAAAGCPSVTPAGFDGCCGTTPCKGFCTEPNCAKCGPCSGADFCCAVNANPNCKTVVSCH